jgi:hypothetical protein
VRARQALVLASIALALSAAGCGGNDDEAERMQAAVVGLYVLDHAGANPTGSALVPYTEAFQRYREGCEGTVDDLADGIIEVSAEASNGSGRTIKNLDVLRAVARAVGTSKEDCAGLLVGVEARLGGGATS